MRHRPTQWQAIEARQQSDQLEHFHEFSFYAPWPHSVLTAGGGRFLTHVSPEKGATSSVENAALFPQIAFGLFEDSASPCWKRRLTTEKIRLGQDFCAPSVVASIGHERRGDVAGKTIIALKRQKPCAARLRLTVTIDLIEQDFQFTVIESAGGFAQGLRLANGVQLGGHHSHHCLLLWVSHQSSRFLVVPVRSR
ncbi:MAG TPA: hypothetical protein PKD31_04465 [Blastocatellia bacterium]|nr:hypothetical protein [Blastocatellia bacterium]